MVKNIDLEHSIAFHAFSSLEYDKAIFGMPYVCMDFIHIWYSRVYTPQVNAQ
jgi:hypothetical protein